MNKILITTYEFLKRYSIADQNFQHLIDTGELHILKIGHQRLLRQEEVDLWLEVHRQLSRPTSTRLPMQGSRHFPSDNVS